MPKRKVSFNSMIVRLKENSPKTAFKHFKFQFYDSPIKRLLEKSGV